ncbi:beta-caryophyllene synthase [Tanacetum coccineum]
MVRGFLDSGGRNNNHRKKPSGDESTVPVTKSEGMANNVITSAGNAPGKSSYANVAGKPNGKKLNIRTLFTSGGKRVAYYVVANYVRNTLGKFRLLRSMFSASTGLFSFQVSSMDGLDAMLENGPWFIQNNLLILKKWHPNENLLKEDVSTVLVWVKLHGVLVTAFSDNGLSSIATKLGTPLMLDSYTSDMCMQSWGSFSGNMKKCVEPTIEVSNSNPFDALNSVDNDVKFGTNGGTSSLGNNEATPSGSSFMNIDNDVEFASNTP